MGADWKARALRGTEARSFPTPGRAQRMRERVQAIEAHQHRWCRLHQTWERKPCPWSNPDAWRPCEPIEAVSVAAGGEQ